jgi:hypothetical protein
LSGIVVYTKNTIETLSAFADGTTDDAGQINAALTMAQATGGTVWLPPGIYGIGSDLIVPPGVTLTGQAGVRTDLGASGAAVQARVKLLSTFAGHAGVSVVDKEVGGYGAENGSVTIRDLNIDCSAKTSGTIDGIQVNGRCDGLRIEKVSIYKPPNCGVRFLQYTRVDTLTYKTINLVMDRVVVHTSASVGFSFSGNTDSEVTNCYSLGAGGDGFTFSTSCANTVVTTCRSEGSANYGFHITGSWNIGTGAGGMLLMGCSTDRSVKHGILVDATGTAPIAIQSPMLRRDGRNGGTGGGSYAGLAVASATVPVLITSPTVFPGVDDAGTGTNSPQYGISITSSTFVAINGGGYLHAQTTAFSADSTSVVSRGPGIAERTGSTSAPGTIAVDNWPRPEWTPEELSYKAFNYDPILVSGSVSGQASGVPLLVRVKVRKAILVTNLHVYVGTLGATLTSSQNLAGLYSISGGTATKLDVTGDQTTAWGSTGAKTMALAGGAQTIQPGDYIVALLSVGGTSAKFGRTSVPAVAQFANGLLGGSGARFATNGTGATALPTTFTLSSNTVSNDAAWVGLS